LKTLRNSPQFLFTLLLAWTIFPRMICAQTIEQPIEQSRALNPDTLIDTSSASVDSLIPSPPMAWVRSSRTVPEIDSLWTDSLWSWRGPCTAPTALIHFEWQNPTDSSQHISVLKKIHCISADEELELNGNSFRGELSADASELYTEAFLSLGHSVCFPPTSADRMRAIEDLINETIFESEKVRLAAQISVSECFNKQQIKQLLKQIPSEDRRLELFKKITDADHAWEPSDVEEIFQLKFIGQKAIQHLDNP
jgi:hypothetical protein